MLNIAELFESLGRIGHTAMLIDIAQAGQPGTFTELSTQSWVNPLWLTSLTQSYDQLIRSESAPMSAWRQAAQQIFLGMVAAANPTYGGGIQNALGYLYNQMVAQGQTVQKCNVTASFSPYSTNIGAGNVFIATVRGDGLDFQNTIAETGQLSITQDSFTGGATVGQEPWLYVGVPNLSSLGTGIPVGVWDWDFPVGSGTVAGGNCISASQYASTFGNFLTNGDMANWTTGPPPVLNNWNLTVGSWGTSAQQSAVSLGGTGFSLQFNAHQANTITQQFGSSAVSGVSAGTPALPPPYTGFAVNLWLIAQAGTMTAGTLVVSLVNAANGDVFNDQSGNPNTQSISLAGLSSSQWTPFAVPFRLPTEPPANFQLQISTTGPTGANLLIDCVAFCAPRLIYSGGMSIAVFSSPATPFHAVPIQDGWQIVTTNDRGGSSFLATFQALLNRLFQSPGFIAPYAASGATLPDTEITNP